MEAYLRKLLDGEEDLSLPDNLKAEYVKGWVETQPSHLFCGRTNTKLNIAVEIRSEHHSLYIDPRTNILVDTMLLRSKDGD